MTEGQISCHFLPPGGSMVPRYVCNFYLVKKYKTFNHSTTTEATEKNEDIFGILIFLEFFWQVLLNLKQIKFLLNKMRHRFQVTTKLFIVWTTPIGFIGYMFLYRVALFHCYAECRYAKHHYAECRGAFMRGFVNTQPCLDKKIETFTFNKHTSLLIRSIGDQKKSINIVTWAQIY